MELFTPVERIGDMKSKAALLPTLDMTKVCQLSVSNVRYVKKQKLFFGLLPQFTGCRPNSETFSFMVNVATKSVITGTNLLFCNFSNTLSALQNRLSQTHRPYALTLAKSPVSYHKKLCMVNTTLLTINIEKVKTTFVMIDFTAVLFLDSHESENYDNLQVFRCITCIKNMFLNY